MGKSGRTKAHNKLRQALEKIADIECGDDCLDGPVYNKNCVHEIAHKALEEEPTGEPKCSECRGSGQIIFLRPGINDPTTKPCPCTKGEG